MSEPAFDAENEEEEIEYVIIEEEEYEESSSSDVQIVFNNITIEELGKERYTSCLGRFQNLCSTFCKNYNLEGEITFSLFSCVLPMYQRDSFGFKDCDIAEITIQLDNYNWNKPPKSISVKNTKYQKLFVGHRHIVETIENFFTPGYREKDKYACAAYILQSNKPVSSELVNKLTSERFDINVVRNLLSNTDNSYSLAREAMIFGKNDIECSQLQSIKYESAQAIYLLLELYETFFNLQNHCYICGEELDFVNIKPSCCNKQTCINNFIDPRFGIPLIIELQRDPTVADLLISSFANADYIDMMQILHYNDNKLSIQYDDCKTIFSKLESVTDLIINYNTESDLYQHLQSIFPSKLNDLYTLIRRILFSNRYQFISIPEKLQPQIWSQTETKNTMYQRQFLVITADSAKEKAFAKNKSPGSDSLLLFHGSRARNWMLILRNGLKIFHGTERMENERVDGEGIYLANRVSMASYYSFDSRNTYIRSEMKRFRVLSVCECIVSKFLQFTGTCWVARQEDLVNLRLLLVDSKFQEFPTSGCSFTSKCIPSWKDIYSVKYNLDKE